MTGILYDPEADCIRQDLYEAEQAARQQQEDEARAVAEQANQWGTEWDEPA